MNYISEQCYHVCNIFNFLGLPIIRIAYPELTLIEFNKSALNELLLMDDVSSERKELIMSGKEINLSPDLFKRSGINNESQMEYTGESMQGSPICIMRSGQKVYYKAIFQPIFNVDGKMHQILITAMDVSKEVKEKEEAKNFLKVKDEFFLFITHEFKAPLTVINAAVQALEVLCVNELSERSKKFIKQIKRSLLRQLRLINNLLDFNKVENGYLKIYKRNIDIIMLTNLIIESVQQYSLEKGVNILFESDIKEKVIAIDEEKYERILLNLLSNAIKFTQRGKNIYIRIFSRKYWICVEVKDEGIGIPKENLRMIFNRYGQVDSSLTRRVEGTGIGLSLVKLLTKEMKAKIFVDSEEGIGSTFTFEIRDEICRNNENENENRMQTSGKVDSRLIQAAAIEFSDIYGK